eukprot:TRINITY_DN25440_c0_g1_i1.p1 TRINITY_DN25440_c0_g1~~TRINITY_DN25440_c0_g1_i1.p1  ORF type:complete len:298 (+),score=141.93 TRINITY_DN25440_c0_g1_i1:51-944(+)
MLCTGLVRVSAGCRPARQQLRTNVSASAIKEIRYMTGAGLLDCKKALAQSEGDMDAALKWLEEKGIAKAGKKRNRTAAAGLVCVVDGEGGAGVVEVNSESDFVAKTDAFKTLTGSIAAAAAARTEGGDVAEALREDAAIASSITGTIASSGENCVLRRGVYVPRPVNGAVGFYVHNKAVGMPSAGLMCAVVALEGEFDPREPEELKKAAEKVAQHIVAESISEDSNVPLLEQKFLQTEGTVGGYLKKRGKAAGCRKVQVASHFLWRVGEGIEVEQVDFAEEVKRMAEQAAGASAAHA